MCFLFSVFVSPNLLGPYCDFKLRKLFQLSPGLQEEAFQGYEIVVLDEAQDWAVKHKDLTPSGNLVYTFRRDLGMTSWIQRLQW